MSRTPPTEDRALLIIQHPGGEPKQVSIQDCRARHLDIPGLSPARTDFGHLCDTLGGSSGSPVQDTSTGEVIGLHHLGFRPDSPLLVNQAVKMGLILSDIRQRKPRFSRKSREVVHSRLVGLWSARPEGLEGRRWR